MVVHQPCWRRKTTSEANPRDEWRSVKQLRERMLYYRILHMFCYASVVQSASLELSWMEATVRHLLASSLTRKKDSLACEELG